MTEYLSDSPSSSRWYCPTCEPMADITKEILETNYCAAHPPDRSGDVDHIVDQSTPILNTEADGEYGRRMAQLLRGEPVSS